MPTIKVLHPFGLRLDSKSPRRTFDKGTHEISDEELNHWFMQVCLRDQRAILLDNKAENTKLMKQDELEAELNEMLNADLIKLIEDKGFTMPTRVNKANLVDTLLSGLAPKNSGENLKTEDENQGFSLP